MTEVEVAGVDGIVRRVQVMEDRFAGRLGAGGEKAYRRVRKRLYKFTLVNSLMRILPLATIFIAFLGNGLHGTEQKGNLSLYYPKWIMVAVAILYIALSEGLNIFMGLATDVARAVIYYAGLRPQITATVGQMQAKEEEDPDGAGYYKAMLDSIGKHDQSEITRWKATRKSSNKWRWAVYVAWVVLQVAYIAGLCGGWITTAFLWGGYGKVPLNKAGAEQTWMIIFLFWQLMCSGVVFACILTSGAVIYKERSGKSADEKAATENTLLDGHASFA